MKVLYTGPFDEVMVPYEEDGTPKTFAAKRGEAAECPDELAGSLLQQGDNWQKAAKAPAPAHPDS